jgi:hypothetical protein
MEVPVKISKQIGDVLAFDRVYLDTIEKARPAFVGIFGDDATSRKILTLRHHAEILDWIMTKLKIDSFSVPESQKKMRDIFKIREEYNFDSGDYRGLFEFLGLLFGGALVHWTTLKKLDKEGVDEDLTLLISKSLLFYRKCLDEVLNVDIED